ncbi:MAG: hypothetical protein IKU58_08500 [Clostridia bacterium]|nr:hypothetical protein [Clostridia bacterium]
MFLFKRRKKRQPGKDGEALLRFAENSRHYEVAAESMDLIRATLNPRTFFGRCDDVAACETRITGQPSAFLADTELQTALQIEFIDRVIAAGRQETMLPYIERLTEEALAHYRSVTVDRNR